MEVAAASLFHFVHVAVAVRPSITKGIKYWTSSPSSLSLSLSVFRLFIWFYPGFFSREKRERDREKFASFIRV